MGMRRLCVRNKGGTTTLGKFLVFASWSMIGCLSVTLASDLTKKEDVNVTTTESAPGAGLSEPDARTALNVADPTEIDGDEQKRDRRSDIIFGGPHQGSSTKSSSSYHGYNCTCVPIYNCPETEVMALDSSYGEVPRGHWHCHSKLEVCCRHPTVTPYPGIITVPTVYPGSTAIPGFRPRCGTWNENGINARILNLKDSETQFGEYPWMAAVLENQWKGGKAGLYFVCGASLIWPSVVATAAHCVKGKMVEHMRIRLGEWDTQSTNEFYPYQDLEVREVVIHPQYYAGSLYNDLALVFLRRPAMLAPHIDTVCLPRQSTSDIDTDRCFATGWGKDSFGETGAYQTILKEVELPIVARAPCQELLRRTNLGGDFNLHPSFLCAGGLPGQDTCVGDGGGPLVCASKRIPWRYELTGIVSWGVKCGMYGVPAAYVDVSTFRNWIDQMIRIRVPNYDTTRVEVPLSGG